MTHNFPAISCYCNVGLHFKIFLEHSFNWVTSVWCKRKITHYLKLCHFYLQQIPTDNETNIIMKFLSRHSFISWPQMIMFVQITSFILPFKNKTWWIRIFFDSIQNSDTFFQCLMLPFITMMKNNWTFFICGIIFIFLNVLIEGKKYMLSVRK